MLRELRISSCVLITPKTDQAILLHYSGQGLLRVLQALVNYVASRLKTGEWKSRRPIFIPFYTEWPARLPLACF